MEIAFITMMVLLTLFAILAIYDGFYLHILKYKLYDHSESKSEHITHTIRSVLFPGILFFCYLTSGAALFFVGLALLAIDIVVTIVDAYVEKDSRAFMGGLPRGEYIIHLLVNGFHFAAIAVFIVVKVRLANDGIRLNHDFTSVQSFPAFKELVEILLPGAVLIALLHILVAMPKTAAYWDSFRSKMTFPN